MLIFNVRNQSLSRVDNFSPTEKSENYLLAVFNFKTDDWKDATKTAVFENPKSKVTKDVILSNDKCLVPWEVLEEKSVVKVSVYGIKDSEKITTDMAEFSLNSTVSGGSATTEPTPDVYQQIINMLEDIDVSGGTDEQIERAVKKYLAENPIGGVDEAEVQRIVAEYVEAHKEELKGDKGEPGKDGSNGVDGKDGADGFSPTIEVNKIDKVTTINITDISGIKTATINDGENGNGIHIGSEEPEDESITLWLDDSEDSEAEVLVNKTNKLYNTKILYSGDSICYGVGYEDGYAGIIAQNTNSAFINYGVGDATLASGTTFSDGTTRHHICEHIQDMDDSADLICFEGGINDCWNAVPLGEIDITSSERFTNELDTTTFAGALESIFRQSIEKWVGTPICFIIVHKAKNIEVQGFDNYHDMIIKVCNKYSIPYCDLYLNSGFNCGMPVLTNNYTANADAVHPNKAGYEKYYVPQIQTLFESIIARKEV